jgi:hypothetical protein
LNNAAQDISAVIAAHIVISEMLSASRLEVLADSVVRLVYRRLWLNLLVSEILLIMD